MNIVTKIVFLIIIFILVILSAFFSASETAYTSASSIRIKTFEKQGHYWAKLVRKHYKSFGWTFSTILLSNNIVNVAFSSLMTYLINDLLNTGPLTTLFSTVIVAPIIVVFGEICPKILARKYSIGYLKKIVYVMEILNYLFFPITFPLSKITMNSKITNSEKDIQSMLSIAHSEGVLETNEATLAQKALELDSKKIKSIMTLKKNIVWLKRTSTVKAAKKKFFESGFSRLLVKDKNSMIGYLILKDIIFAKNRELIKKFVVPISYISSQIIVSNALEKMRINNSHMSLVSKNADSKDFVGIITIEDIIEELFGEIYDEHDPIKKVKEVSHFKYIVNGSIMMKELSKELNFKFENMENITVKKWIQSRINRKIRKNLKYKYKNKIIFEIIRNKNNTDTIIQIFRKGK